MNLYTSLALISLLTINAWAQTVGAFSPVPIWPQGGALSVEETTGSYVFFDPGTDEYVLHYPAELGSTQPRSGRMVTIRIELQNRSRPSISVEMRQLNQTQYEYVYTLRNASIAKAPISTWALVAAATDDTIQLSHPRWRTFGSTSTKPAVAPQAALLDGPALRKRANFGKFVRWAGGPQQGVVHSGASVGGFTAISDHRPGWTTAYVGGGRGIQLPHELPAEVYKQLEELQKPENYESTVLTFGPKFSPSDTDQVVAADWHLAVQKLITRKVLDENSVFVQQILHLLQTVIHGESASGMSLSVAPSTPVERQVASGLILALRLKQ